MDLKIFLMILCVEISTTKSNVAPYTNTTLWLVCQTEMVWGELEASYLYIVSGCGARAAASADSYKNLSVFHPSLIGV